MRPLFRPTPKLSAAQMKTYAIVAPRETHTRRATCEEVSCPAFTNGWRLRKELLTLEMLHTIAESKRSYTEMSIKDGETWLVFAPGQPCFSSFRHRVRLDRPELFIVQGGDYRGNPLGIPTTRHSGADAWVDDFATHQEKIANETRKG